MNVENDIEVALRELQPFISQEFNSLYKDVSNSKLCTIFSSLHSQMIPLFKSMNSRLPTNQFTSHFWADPSRKLIQMIDCASRLQRSLKESQFSFSFDKYYNELFNKCNEFLSESGGSEIPSHMDKIDLYYVLPIFIMNNSVTVDTTNRISNFELKLIGEGSYAKVFKYKDNFYNKNFALKRANKGLNEKELLRFKKEYEVMSGLSSPYVTEIYGYNDVKNEYVMEYLDSTLKEYICNNNAKLTNVDRVKIINQIIAAFTYLNSKGVLHRDISTTNILLKRYEQTFIVKVSDFGLVKLPDSTLTSDHTEFKGSLNDPALLTTGFNNYEIRHETYALTRLVLFVLTGKTNIENLKGTRYDQLLSIGLNPDINRRYNNALEIQNCIKSIMLNR